MCLKNPQTLSPLHRVRNKNNHFVFIENRHAERTNMTAIRNDQRIQVLNEARTLIPADQGIVHHPLLDESARESRARHKVSVLTRLEATLPQIRHQLVLDLIVALEIPVDSRVVHLVYEHDQKLHAGCLDQHGMLPRLTTSLKAGLELALARRNHQDGNVGLGGASDHVRDEASVAGRVQNNKVLLFGLEKGATDLVMTKSHISCKCKVNFYLENICCNNCIIETFLIGQFPLL